MCIDTLCHRVILSQGMTHTAASMMQPPDLRFRFALPAGQPGGGAACLRDLSPELAAARLPRLPHTVGPVWGARCGVGQVLHCTLDVIQQASGGADGSLNTTSSSSCSTEVVEFSVACVNLAGPDAAAALHASPHLMFEGTAITSDPSVIFIGCTEGIAVELPDAGAATHRHPLSLLCVQPGLFQLVVTGVSRRCSGSSGAGHDAALAGSSGHVVVDKLNLLCL